MKRSMESPEAGREKSFRRQNPVSCQFCRSKKLKCDRATPCSNCVARNVECIPAIGGNPAEVTATAVADRTRPPASRAALPGTSTESIESRLRRLEEAVFATNHGDTVNGVRLPDEAGTLNKTADWLDGIPGAGSRRSTLPLTSTNDAKGSGMVGSPAATDSPFPDLSTAPPLQNAEIVAALPDEATAMGLCQYYVEFVSWVYHIVHAPTLYAQLRGVYASLNASQFPVLSHLAVVSTVISIGAYFKSGHEPPSAQEEIKASCKRWAIIAQRALIEARHGVSPTIETIQATILINQFLPNFARTDAHASFTATIINSAHALQLHQVDSLKNRKLREQGRYNVVELELKRRLWWHIAGTDWILSFMSGPQSGTYLVNPAQMNVAIPSNCDDAELTPTSCVDHPFDTPTEMSYSITKIHMATAIRGIVDDACAQGVEVDDADYDTILSSDRRLTSLLSVFPWYFRLDEASRHRASIVDQQRPHIRWQRHMVHFGYNTRLSRLHRPYLARGYRDPQYAYSRMMCLRAARLVIEMEQNMREIGGFQPDPGRLWIVIHHVFVATVTLVMDYCCHRDDPQAAERKAEIMRCYQILEKSQEESTVAKKGLAHLKQVMRDWKVKTETEGQVLEEQDAQTLETGEYPTPENKLKSPTREAQQQNVPTQPVIGFNPQLDFGGMDTMEDMWMEPLNFPMNNDPQWEALFRDLEQPQVFFS